MATERRGIIDGPSKWDFIMSVADGNSSHRNKALFRLVGSPHPDSLWITVNAIEREDGSGEHWLFKGYYELYKESGSLHGFYDCQRRKGWVELKSNRLKT